MLKTKYLILLSTFLVFMFTLLAATDAAACVEPYCFTVKGWEVEIVTGSNGEFPVIQSDGSPRFEYKITPAPSGNRVNQVYLLVPVCSEAFSIEPVAYSTPSFQYFEAGAGDPTTGVGVGDKFQRVMSWPVRINPGTSFRNIWVDTTLAIASVRSMSLKIGNTIVTGGILGPFCADQVPFESTRIFDGLIGVDFDQATGTPFRVYDAQQPNVDLTPVVLHVCEDNGSGEADPNTCNRINKFGPKSGCVIYANPSYYGYGGSGYRR